MEKSPVDFKQAMYSLHRVMRRANVSSLAEVTIRFASYEDRARFETILKEIKPMYVPEKPEDFDEMEWYGIKVRVPWPEQ